MEEMTYPSPSDEKEEDILDPFCDPDHPKMVPFEEVTTAAEKIKSGVMCTPCTHSRLSELFGIELYFKKDFLQFTGNFKERGARYALLMLDDEKKKKGVVSASAGNHAQAICYHGRDLGVPVTVVMPAIAPIMKITQCRKFNATVLVQGRDMAESKRIALKYAQSHGMTYINGYDHPHIIAGQGTIAMEVVEQVPDLDAIVVPVGGGGLIAGISLAMHHLKPNVKVIGVESEKCPGFSASMKAGKPTVVKSEPSVADGLAVPLIGFNSFVCARDYLQKVALVKEESIAVAILRLVEVEKCVVEGAGATTVAAAIEGHLNEFKGKKVVLVLSGGNIDTTVLGRVLDRGLAADGRLVRMTVTVSDRPGGVAELCTLVASIGVSIKDMVYERAWVTHDIFSVDVTIACETRDATHTSELRSLLKKSYKKVNFHEQSVPCSNKPSSSE